MFSKREKKEIRLGHLFFFLLLTACTPKKLVVSMSASVLEDALPAVEAESDIDIAQEFSLISIKQIEGFHHAHQKNKKLLTLLARGYAGYAFGFLEEALLEEVDKEKKQIIREKLELFYTRGLNFGLQALPDLANSENFLTWKEKLGKMRKSKAPTLFWTAFNWGGLIRLKPDDPQNLIDLAKAEVMMQRVYELDPSYYYGSAAAFLGGIEAMRPPLFGGKPERAKRLFEEAIQTSHNKFLMHHVMYAQFFAQNRDDLLKQSLLKKVIGASNGILPEQQLANQLAKRRAILLLNQ